MSSESRQRKCLQCDSVLPANSHSRRLYCGQPCRLRAHRARDAERRAKSHGLRILQVAPLSEQERAAMKDATGDEMVDNENLPDYLPLGPIAQATMVALKEVGRDESPLGLAAFKIALRLDNSNREGGNSVARLASQLEQTLKAANENASSGMDPLDEIAKRAREKRGNATG